MLDATEANLKKIAGKQLTANEQDMVNQTRQFIQQSKAAVEAGDLERARTLAWKAHVLSDELVKPEK
jgi:iron uptake system EfeUOB component EfeO/EfeM